MSTSSPVPRHYRTSIETRLKPRVPPAPNAPQGEHMAYWRVNRLRLTQVALAKLLKVRRSTVWRYETGEQPMTTMFRLACIGLTVIRPWDPDEWPFYGDKDAELEAFRRQLAADDAAVEDEQT